MSHQVKRPSIGVVLLNWNCGEFTFTCINSLLAGAIKPDKIVVVDNASVDGSVDEIAVSFPDIIIIRNETNRGFSGGNDQGIAYLLSQGVDYIWLLNNDTTVAEDCLEKLITAAILYPNAAGFSAKIFYDAPPGRIWYAGAYRHRWHLGTKHLLEPVLDEKAKNGVAPVPFISGCCMFVPSWAWEQYGDLKEEYVCYAEDNEWCWRVTKSGGTLCYVPSAVLWHKLSASIGRNTETGKISGIPSWALYFMCRNQFWTVRQHAEGFGRKVALGVNVGIVMKNVAMWLFQGKTDLVRSSFEGLIDGFRCSPKTKRQLKNPQ
jgi:GT2 family glycosyltransferase